RGALDEEECFIDATCLVQLCFDFYMIEAKPENLIGDRAYDSDPLDAELRKDGIEMIAPHRGNRSKPATQDRRRLSRYMRRWLVERFFAWIQWQRRILIRWERRGGCRSGLRGACPGGELFLPAAICTLHVRPVHPRARQSEGGDLHLRCRGRPEL